jgi:hypothetical protein
MIEYNKRTDNRKKIKYRIKKIKCKIGSRWKRIKGPIETSPDTQLRTAKTQTTKLFNKTLKANPKACGRT